jgi:ABC-type multidrug transport system ATPase subunit
MKAMLVAALAPEPNLLLLDEPFAGLDPLAREEVLRGVLGQIRSEGRTVLCATHDLDVASRLADRIALIAQGQLREEGTLEEILGTESPTRIPDRILERIREVVAAAGEVC